MPTSHPRSIEEIVDEIIASTTPLGSSVTADQLAASYGVVGPQDCDYPVVAKVTSTPVDLADYETFEPLFDDHTGTFLFSVNLVEERKLPSLSYAYAAYGDESGLDRAYLSRFTMRVSELLTVSKPQPGAMPVKGMSVTLGLEIAPEPDDQGDPVVRVSTFSVPKPKAARRARIADRVKPPVSRPAQRPAREALAVSGDGHAGDDGRRLVAEV